MLTEVNDSAGSVTLFPGTTFLHVNGPKTVVGLTLKPAALQHILVYAIQSVKIGTKINYSGL